MIKPQYSLWWARSLPRTRDVKKGMMEAMPRNSPAEDVPAISAQGVRCRTSAKQKSNCDPPIAWLGTVKFPMVTDSRAMKPDAPSEYGCFVEIDRARAGGHVSQHG